MELISIGIVRTKRKERKKNPYAQNDCYLIGRLMKSTAQSLTTFAVFECAVVCVLMIVQLFLCSAFNSGNVFFSLCLSAILKANAPFALKCNNKKWIKAIGSLFVFIILCRV